MKHRFALLFIVIAMLAALVAPAVAQDTPVLIMGSTQEPDVMSPWYGNSRAASIFTSLWFTGLWGFNQDGSEILPYAVEEAPTLENGLLAADGKSVTFTISADAKWSDGTPVTADDVLFFDEMANTAANTMTGVSTWQTFVDSVTADGSTVTITFTDVYPDWFIIAQFALLPKHILQPVFEANGTIDGAAWNTDPEVSFGPYSFVSWERGVLSRFAANPNWHLGTPKIGELVMQYFADDATLQAAFAAGEIDWADNLALSDAPTYGEVEGATVIATDAEYDDALWLNVTDSSVYEEGVPFPALNDVNVRKAIALALDRETIANEVQKGLATVPVVRWNGYWENTELAPYPYDPEESARLLDEAGWVDSDGDGTRDKDGQELVLKYFTTPASHRLDSQVLVTQYLNAVGIGVQTFAVPGPAVLFADYANRGINNSRTYDISQFAYSSAFLTPSGAPDFSCTTIASAENPAGDNMLGFCNEEHDQVVAQMYVEPNPEARRELAWRVQELWYENYMWIGMYSRPDVTAVNATVNSESLSLSTVNGSTNSFWNVANWELAGA